MLISANEITWGPFNFNRADVKGFKHEKNEFYIYLGNTLNLIHLGFDQKPWPFGYSTANGWPHLVYNEFRFLPEHVQGYSEEHLASPTINVWTELGQFTINRVAPIPGPGINSAKGFQNSLADEWKAAYDLHLNTLSGV